MDPQAEHSGSDTAADLRSLLPHSIKSLSRSASQPVVFPRKHLERRLNKLNASRHQGGNCGGSGGGATEEGGVDGGTAGGGSRHEDDLDIIKQIIDKDETLHDTADQVRQGGMHFRSQSLSHIPGEFSSVSSLPTLSHAESMHLLHSNYFSAPDFSQLGSPPSFGTKHGGGGGANDVVGGDLSYHQLTHESRSSSLGDCHSSIGSLTNQQPAQPLGSQQQQQQPPLQQQVNNFSLNGERRGSNFDAHSMTGAYNSNSLNLSHQGDGGFGASTHASSFDFTRHRDSSHSLSYSGSEGNQTPGSYDLSRRDSSISDALSTASGSISFQFPSLARNANPLSFSNTPTSQDSTCSHIEGGGAVSSSSHPLRDYLTSQTTTSLITGADPFERMTSCKTISRVENPSHIPGSLTSSTPNSKGMCVCKSIHLCMFVCVKANTVNLREA